MGAHRSSFGKLERDRAKKAKAAVKRERRQSREPESPEEDSGSAVTVADHELPAGDLIQMVETLHQEFEAKLISFEDYEKRKADILSRLSVE